MPGHFTVDLDVASLRAAQRWLDTMADEAPREAEGMTGVPGRIGDDWTGPASQKIKEEMRDLARSLRDFGPSFGDARDAVKTFADAADTFETTTLPDFNRRWDELNDDAEADMRAADRRAENAEGGERPAGQSRGDVASGLRYALQGLTHEFEEAKDELRRKATRLGTALSATSPVTVPEAAVTSFTSSGESAESLTDWPTVSPEASNALRVDVTPESIDAFDFSDMTEEERREFNERNPGVLDGLMREPDPGDHLKEQVLALGTPQVDGADGRSDAERVERGLTTVDGTEQDVADGMASSQEFARYAEWAQRHGGPPLADDQVAYLTEWNAVAWERGQEIEGYGDDELLLFGQPVSEGADLPGALRELDGDQADAFRRTVSDNLMMASDHRLGGGYEQLPDEVRGALEQVPEYPTSDSGTSVTLNGDFLSVAEVLRSSDLMPGDGLAKTLATTSTTSLDMTSGPLGRADYPQDLIGDMLSTVGRNRHATTELLTGDDMPEGYDPSHLLRTIYTYEWDDDGAKAAEMTSWIGEVLRETDHPGRRQAFEAFDGLARGLSGTARDGHTDVFRDLMDADHDNNSVGQINPALAQELARGMHNTDVMRALGRDVGDTEDVNEMGLSLTEAERTRLIMLIAGDKQAAEQIAASTQQAMDLEMQSYDGQNRNTVAEIVGRLASITEGGIYNEALERDLNASDAATEKAERMTGGLRALAGQVPKVGPFLGPFIKVDAENPVPDDPLSTDWDPTGAHVTINGGLSLARRIADQEGASPTDLPPTLVRPQDYSQGEVLDALEGYMSRRNIDLGTLNDSISSQYGDNFDYFTPESPEKIDDFIDSGHL